jgi:aurora kinase A
VKTLNTDKSLKNIKVTSSVELSKVMPKSSRSLRLDYDEKLRKAISDLSEGPRRKQLCIEDFDLGRKLGKGRFGNVYLAQEKATKFALAVKVINRRQLKDSEMENQLLEEIKLQTFMNHPNILRMYGCLRDSKNIYLLLELGTGCLFRELRYRVNNDLFRVTSTKLKPPTTLSKSSKALNTSTAKA